MRFLKRLGRRPGTEAPSDRISGATPGPGAVAILAVLLAASGCGEGKRELLGAVNPAAPTTEATDTTGYAEVNGLHMYFEVHGTGAPVILLHGAYMSAASMKPVWEVLARSRKVIVPEAQGHAHTADIDRPFSYQAMADDVAALMATLGLQEADVVGYSMGAHTAFQLAVRHPSRVKRLVLASGAFQSSGMYPEVVRRLPSITPDVFRGSPMEAEYRKVSPTPQHFESFLAKLTRLDAEAFDWEAAVPAIEAPTLIVVGDQDVVRPEHAVEMFRLLGGGVPGDMGLPPSEDQLAVLPDTTHQSLISKRAETFARLVRDFIDPPPPPARATANDPAP